MGDAETAISFLVLEYGKPPDTTLLVMHELEHLTSINMLKETDEQKSIIMQ